MESETETRESRVARNQLLFRAVNERLKELNDALVRTAGSYPIACECAEASCIETFQIGLDEYNQVRAQPQQFVVRPGHVIPEAERVVYEYDGYAVVEGSA